MSDFSYKGVFFGSVDYINNDTNKPGYQIIFSGEIGSPSVKEILESLENDDEKHHCWNIDDDRPIVEMVKSFSSDKAIEIMKSEFRSSEEVNEALELLQREFN